MDIDNKQIDTMNQEQDEVSLKELIIKLKEWLGYLQSKSRIIIFVGIIGGIIGLTIAFLNKPVYKAVLTFAMEEDKGAGGGGLSGALGLASSFGIDLGGGGGGGAFAAANLAELMKSRLIVVKVLLNSIQIKGKITTLAEYYIEQNKLRVKWSNIPALKNIYFGPGVDVNKFTLEQDSVLEVIHQSLISSNRLSILQKDNKITILYVEVKNEDELYAKFFCENLAKETSALYIQTKSKKARVNVEVLQKQVDSIRLELNSAISGVANEVDQVFNLNPAFNIKGATSKKKQIDVQANSVILTNIAVQLELAKITLRRETPLIQLIDIPIFPLLKDKISKRGGIMVGGILGILLCIMYLSLIQILRKLIS